MDSEKYSNKELYLNLHNWMSLLPWHTQKRIQIMSLNIQFELLKLNYYDNIVWLKTMSEIPDIKTGIIKTLRKGIPLYLSSNGLSKTVNHDYAILINKFYKEGDNMSSLLQNMLDVKVQSNGTK